MALRTCRNGTNVFAVLIAALLFCSCKATLGPANLSDCRAIVAETAKPTPAWIAREIAQQIDEPVDDPAAMCPADAQGYLRVDGLAQWRQTTQSDPLAEHVWQTVQAFGPPKCWERAATHLGLDNDAMLDRYFGQTVALVMQRVEHRTAVIVMSRVSPEALRQLPTAAGLKPWRPPGWNEVSTTSSIGPFSLFSTVEDGDEFIFAIGKRWLIIAEQRRIEHLRRMLTVTSSPDVDTSNAPLATAPHYQQMFAKLPAQHTALLFTSNPDATERHAACIVRQGHDITVHYVATGAKLTRPNPHAVRSKGIDFGLLPTETVSAATINILDRSPRQFGLLDVMLFPHKIKTHILPKLSPPMIVFLGQVPGHEVSPDLDAAVPVVGVMVKLNDDTATASLNRLIKGLHFLANLGELDLIRSIFGVRRVNAGDTTFHVADFGQALAKRLKDPQLSPLIGRPG